MSRLLTDVQVKQIGLLLSETSIGLNFCRRLKTILMLDGGVDEAGISVILGASISTVRKWKERFIDMGLEGLRDAPRTRILRRPVEPDVIGLEEGSTAVKLIKGQIKVRTLAAHLQISSNMIPVVFSKNSHYARTSTVPPVIQAPVGADDEGCHISAIYLSRRLYLIVTRLQGPMNGGGTGSRVDAIQQDNRSDQALSVVMEAKSLKRFLNHVDDDGDLHSRYTAHARYLRGPMRLVVEEWIALRGNWDYIITRPHRSRTAVLREPVCDDVES